MNGVSRGPLGRVPGLFAPASLLLVASILATLTVPDDYRSLFSVAVFGGVGIGVMWLWVGTYKLGTMFLALMLFTVSYTGIRLTTAVSLADVFLLISGAFLLPGLVLRRPLRVPSLYPWLIIGAALLFLGGMLGSIFGAESPVASMAELLKFMLTILVLPLVVVAWAPNVRGIRRMSWVWLSGIVVNVAVGTVEIQTSHQGRVDGLTLHPNALGLSSVFGASAALGLAATGKGIVRWGAYVATAICAMGVMISGSRAAAGSLVVAFAVFFLLTRQFRLIAGLVLLGLVGVGILLSPLVQLPEGNALSRIIASRNSTSSLNVVQSNLERDALLEEAIEGWSQNPLTGIGFEDAASAHNIFVQVASSGGPIAFLGYLLIIFVLSFPALLLVARGIGKRDNSTSLLLAGMSSGLIGYLAGGFFHNALWERYLWVAPAFILALTMQETPWSKSEYRLVDFEESLGSDPLSSRRRSTQSRDIS
jgi:hypothetical protein